MIIACGGIKGGSGKTTVAINLAVMRALQVGNDVLLVDADEQESAYTFSQVRAEATPDRPAPACVKLTGLAVGRETRRMSQRYSDIIIDTGGRDTTSQRAALAIADVVLLPMNPRSLVVWTLGRVEQLIEEAQAVNPKLRALMFLNQADARGQDNQEAAAILRASSVVTFLEATLGLRKAFANATAIGLSVNELLPPDVKASAEMWALCRSVYAEHSADIYPAYVAAAAGGAR